MVPEIQFWVLAESRLHVLSLTTNKWKIDFLAENFFPSEPFILFSDSLILYNEVENYVFQD